MPSPAAQLTPSMMMAEQALDFIRRNPGAVTETIERGVPLTEHHAVRAATRLHAEQRIAWSEELCGWVAVEKGPA